LSNQINDSMRFFASFETTEGVSLFLDRRFVEILTTRHGCFKNIPVNMFKHPLRGVKLVVRILACRWFRNDDNKSNTQSGLSNWLNPQWLSSFLNRRFAEIRTTQLGGDSK
jgi:hypothetical protein